MVTKERIKKLIAKNRVGMFVTQDKGRLFSRPIGFADVDDKNQVWFFSDIESDKIDDIINNNNVNFSFANPSDNSYVSLSGKASLISDESLIDEKWKFFMKAWFPEGKDSDKLTLIKVVPETVQYWDGTNSRIAQMYNMTKALVTGKAFVDVSQSDNELVTY